jgi:hypothetical protein
MVDLVGIEPTTSSMPWKKHSTRRLILKQLTTGGLAKNGYIGRYFRPISGQAINKTAELRERGFMLIDLVTQFLRDGIRIHAETYIQSHTEHRMALKAMKSNVKPENGLRTNCAGRLPSLFFFVLSYLAERS